jgi:hypothetical protein
VTWRSKASPVRPSNSWVWPVIGRSASSSIALISASAAPSNTGVAIGTPSVRLPASVSSSSSLNCLRSTRSPCLAVVVVDLVEELAQVGDLGLLLEHALDLLAQALGGPAQMHFQDLADVHSATARPAG